MSYYSVSASPFFYEVSCPKHKDYMTELKNGFFGEKLWWCEKCERPYHLKPSVMKIGSFDRKLVDEQLEELKKKKTIIE